MKRDWLRIGLFSASILFLAVMGFLGVSVYYNVLSQSTSSSVFSLTSLGLGTSQTPTVSTVSTAVSTSSYNGVGYGCSPGGCTPCDLKVGACFKYSLLSLVFFSGPVVFSTLFWVVLIAAVFLLGFLIAEKRKLFSSKSSRRHL